MKKLIFIVAALAMITGSAYAADWNFYGSARVQTWYNDVEDNAVPTSSSATNLDMGLQGNARIGANVKVSDELTGRFEYGASSGNANIRLLYGTWNFGGGTLRIGQDYTPLYLPVSNQVYTGDYGLGGYGEPYPGRKAQIKLTFGGFQIAIVEPNGNFDDGTGADDAVDTATEIKIPQIQSNYKLAMDNWNLALGAGYATFEETTLNNSVDSFVVTVRGGMTFGALKLGAEVFGGSNVGNIVAVDVNGIASGAGLAEVTAGTVVDNDAYGYEIVAGYTINDMFGLEAGVGFVKTELDEANSTKDEVIAYYVQAPITLAPGVFIVPEFGVFDYKETEQSETTYFGAKWQINF